jgi:hypothetical protein
MKVFYLTLFLERTQHMMFSIKPNCLSELTRIYSEKELSQFYYAFFISNPNKVDPDWTFFRNSGWDSSISILVRKIEKNNHGYISSQSCGYDGSTCVFYPTKEFATLVKGYFAHKINKISKEDLTHKILNRYDLLKHFLES